MSLPVCSTISTSAFYNCSSLSTFYAGDFSIVGTNAFALCFSLNTVIFDGSNATATKTIMPSAFRTCHLLLSLYLLTSTVVKLSNTNAFTTSPISTYTTSTGGVNGSVFVPASLYSTYSTSTNWTTYAARIVSLTDTEIQNVRTYGKHDP